MHRLLVLPLAAIAACGGDTSMTAELVDAQIPTPTCTDKPPGERYTCGEQLAWNKCEEDFMQGYCNRSCGRCDEIGNLPTCEDRPPAGDLLCESQAQSGQCPALVSDGHCLQSCSGCEFSQTLIDPDANEETKALFSFLVKEQGQHILAGQQNIEDAEYMKELTGKYPAMVGFDFMDYSPSRVQRGTLGDDTEEAIAWHNRGGIVTFSWHWNAPDNLLDTEEMPWWRGFYTRATDFDLPAAIDEHGSRERAQLIRDIDAIAIELRDLQAARVPILWRPIHEAAGEWFWWGAHGPRIHKALWRLLYDRLVNHHQLHNLIWVWNGQHRDWYPGDVYVDIIAEDIYDEGDHSPQVEKFLEAKHYTNSAKLVALSETGSLLPPQGVEESAAQWSWFLLWSGHFAQEGEWNSDELKREVYQSEYVLTLEELAPRL